MKKSVITIVFALHFSLIAVFIISKQSGAAANKHLANYINTYFPQEWEMFAPPPTANTRLFYRYIICVNDKKDTTRFHEILKALYRHQLSDIYSISRLSYYLFNCTQSISLNYVYHIKHLPGYIRRDNTTAVKNYMREVMARSYSHKSLLRHGQYIYTANYAHTKADSVLISYHILTSPFKASKSDMKRQCLMISHFYTIARFTGYQINYEKILYTPASNQADRLNHIQVITLFSDYQKHVFIPAL